MDKWAFRSKTGVVSFVLSAPLVALGCSYETEDLENVTFELVGDSFSNAKGASRILSVSGAAIDENNPFFQSLGVNGRACVNCHQPSAAMGITPPQIRQVFDATQGLDPLFRTNDGANGPNAPVATLAQRRTAYSLLLSKGLIRIPINLPASRDFDVRVILDPYAGTGANPPLNQTVPANSTSPLSFYRRPLLSANTRFISAVMWDGREQTVPAVPANPRDTDNSGIQAFQSDARPHQHADAIEQRNAWSRRRTRSADRRATRRDHQLSDEFGGRTGKRQRGGRAQRERRHGWTASVTHAANVLRYQ